MEHKPQYEPEKVSGKDISLALLGGVAILTAMFLFARYIVIPSVGHVATEIFKLF